jgi:hypothetical protein
MVRPRYSRDGGPLPPPLPPETRTVGQLVAESLRLYGRHFWAVSSTAETVPAGLAGLALGEGVLLAVLLVGANRVVRDAIALAREGVREARA